MFYYIKNIFGDIKEIIDYVYDIAHYYIFGAEKDIFDERHINNLPPLDGVKTNRLCAGKEEVLMTKKNAATKAWETRRALAAKRSAAAKKAWVTRRKMAKKTK